MIKKIIIKLFFWSDLGWCKMFHTSYGIGNGLYECPKCKIPHPPNQLLKIRLR